MRRFSLLLAFFSLVGSALADKPISITFVHSNDMHAHVMPFNIQGASFGGYARQATLIRRIRKSEKNVLLLNAGDMFQGTLYFNVYQGLAELAYMNAIHYDVMCLGNHEFDRGPENLARFVRLATFPVLSANLDFQNEPSLKRLVVPSTVLAIGGEKIGVVGATTPEVTNISSPGPNVSLKDLRSSVQAAVDDLTKKGINKIVLLTHVGYREEQELVSGLHDVDLLIGGHSHTPLGTPDIKGWRTADGPYPTHVKDARGQDVLVVQAYEFTKVLGCITVDFDSGGHVVKWSGGPIVEDATVPEDPEIKGLVTALEVPILNLQNTRYGSTTVAIPKESKGGGDSLMSDVIADAMLAATAKLGAVAAFINSGGVRGGLEPGDITYGEAISVQPFAGTLTTLDLTGSELAGAIEDGVGNGGLLLPSAGSGYVINQSKPKGQRVSEVTLAGQPIDPQKIYRVTLPTFTSNGGDAQVILKSAKGPRHDTGIIDLDALLDYIKTKSPLSPKNSERVRLHN